MRDMMVSGVQVSERFHRIFFPSDVAQLTRRVHDAANDESGGRTTGQMERRAFLHAQMLDQTTLGKEVGRQLDGATETSPNHGGADSTVQTTNALTLVDLTQAVERVTVLVLGTNGKERRIRLETSLDKEEGRSACGTDDTGRGTGEDVDSERLDRRIVVDSSRHALAQGLVEA